MTKEIYGPKDKVEENLMADYFLEGPIATHMANIVPDIKISEPKLYPTKMKMENVTKPTNRLHPWKKV